MTAESRTSDTFDLTIIGAGPGGYVAAIRAAQLGARVALVERQWLGGTCLNVGCIPSKAILHAAELYRQMLDAGEFGLPCRVEQTNMEKLFSRKDRVVSALVKGIEMLMKKNQVTVFMGHGAIASPERVVVTSDRGEDTVATRKILIATGSVSARPPIPGLDGQGVIFSDGALSLARLPESIVIIGGGAIGAEFGTFYSSFGVKVTIIEMLDHVLPLEDPECVEELMRAYKRAKVDILAPAQVKEIKDGDRGKVVVYSKDGKEGQVQAELVLMATGRWPYLEGLGVEELGLEKQGRALKVNAKMETNVPGIYACGDAIGGMLLAHLASREGKVAVENARGGDVAMDYRAVPAVVFTNPEVASVGLNEEAARQAGHDVHVGRFPFRALGKAQAVGDRTGFVKTVAEAKKGTLLGIQIVGARATDLIAEATVAVQSGLTAEALGVVIHAHPTLPEAIGEAAEAACGRAIHI